MNRKRKTFDCVEMKRRVQERIYEETKGMTPAELVAYFHKRVAEGPFSELWKKVAARQKERASSTGPG